MPAVSAPTSWVQPLYALQASATQPLVSWRWPLAFLQRVGQQPRSLLPLRHRHALCQRALRAATAASATLATARASLDFASMSSGPQAHCRDPEQGLPAGSTQATQPSQDGPTLHTPLLPACSEQHTHQPWHRRPSACYCLAAASSALLLFALLLSSEAWNTPTSHPSARSSHHYQCPAELSPSPADLTFFIVGDWGRRGNPNQVSALHIMQDIASCLPPDFIISTGDNFYPSGLSQASDPMISESFTQVYSSPGLQVPWYSVLGNHDYGDSFPGSWKRCPKPQELSDCGDCCISPLWQVPAVNPELPRHWNLRQGAWVQSFLGGQLDIVFIDTTPFIRSYYKKSWADVTGGIVYQNTTAQEEEVEALLLRSTAPWKLVVGHHPVYSFGEHCSGAPKLSDGPGAGADADADADVEERRKNQCADMRWLQQLMVKHEVAAYLCGHDHDLQYIRHLDDPLHYVVSGAGSDIRPNEFDDADTSSLSQHFFADDQGFVVARLRGDTMYMHFYTAASDEVSYTLSFTSRARS